MNNTFIYGVELDDLASQEIYYALRDNPGSVNLDKNVQLGLFTKDLHQHIKESDYALGTNHLFGVQFDFNQADVSSEDIPERAKDLFDSFALPILTHFGENTQPSILKVTENS